MNYVIKPTFGVTGKSGAGAESVNGLRNNLITVFGAPPLTVTNAKVAVPQSIKIYGNTVSENGVGNLNNDGVYEIPLTISGINLFNYTEWNVGTIEYDGRTCLELSQIDNTVTQNNINIPQPLVKGIFEANTQYAISCEIYTQHTHTGLVYTYTDNTLGYTQVSADNWTRLTMVSSANKTISFIRRFYGYLSNQKIEVLDISSCMLNKGASPLPWEPYFVPKTIRIKSFSVLKAGEAIEIYPLRKKAFFIASSGIRTDISLLQQWSSDEFTLTPYTNIITSNSSVPPASIEMKYFCAAC